MSDSLTSTQRVVQSGRRREMLRSKQLVQLLQSSGNVKLRSFRVINELIPLLQELPFFIDFTTNFRLLSDIAQRVEYRHCKVGENIYRIKEPANYFYIILEGTVQLTIPEEIQLVQEKPQEEEEYLQKEIFQNFFQVQKEDKQNQEIEHEKQRTPSPQNFIDKIIGSVERGGCFGEMMADASIRVTNATALEECHLLAISKKAYEGLLKAQLRTDKRSKFLFLSSLPVLAPLHTFALESLCLRLSEKELSYGQALFEQGQEIKQVFIVQSGEFKLLKALPKHSACGVERRIRGKSEYKCITLPTKQVPFAIVQAGEILGDGEILALQRVYQQLCICQSQTAKVYVIDKRQYFKCITNDKEIFECLRRMIQQKHKRRKLATTDFLQRRSRQSYMNTLLNSNEWAIRPKEFVIRDKSMNTSISSLTSDDIAKNDNFFINQLNKTLAPNTKANRFSIKQKKCRTEKSQSNRSQTKLDPIIRNKKKDGVPHCVQDIVSIVKLKTNFLRRFRKQRKRQRNVFKFDKQAVPLFIKSKYNKIDAA